MSGPAERLSLPIMLLRCRAIMLAVALVAVFFLTSVAPAQAATITVTSTGEGTIGTVGQCTLSEALDNANSDSAIRADCVGGSGTELDTILFNIPAAQCPGGVCTIRPTFTYNVLGQTTIDGYTQPGASANTLAVGNDAVLRIELSGEEAPLFTNALKIVGGTVTVRGLVINHYAGGLGIYVTGGSNHRIVGNFVGTDASGTFARPNLFGIIIGTSGTTNTVVGGTTPAARNLISGNGDFGIALDQGTTGNRIEGNYIGTRAGGTQALGNVTAGIIILNSPANTVGGTAPGAGNLISGNGVGLYVQGLSTTGTSVQGNLIGTEATGATPLGNVSHGVVISTSNTTVGGTEPGASNTIAFNGVTADTAGVLVSGGVGNAILGNRIFSNLGLGINLLKGGSATDGVTLNDVGDGDIGPNLLQNFPVLTSASVGAATTVGGTLNSTPNRVYRIELFSSPTCDPSGNGEGQTLLGFVTPSIDSTGNASFAASLPTVTAGHVIAATATNLSSNDTSEFSACLAVQQAGFTVTPISGPTTEANEGGAADTSFTVRLNSVPTANVTLALSVSDPTEGAIVGPTTLTFTPANATTPQTVQVIGIDDTLADGAVAYGIVFGAATGADTAYAGLKPPDVVVTNIDDDTPCSPRPNVRVTTVVPAPGQLQTTIATQTTTGTPTNGLISIRLTHVVNAAIQLDGSLLTVGPTITLPANTTQVVLLVQRIAPDQNPNLTSTVAFAVSDACGEWKSFVGGGPTAF